MDLFVGLAIAALGVRIFMFLANPKTARGLDLFASGFLPYRAELGWPRGVQEEEPVPWSWSSGGRPAELRWTLAPSELDTPARGHRRVPRRRGSIVRGMARGRR